LQLQLLYLLVGFTQLPVTLSDRRLVLL